ASLNSWCTLISRAVSLFFFQAEDGIRDFHVTGVQTCALPISLIPCGNQLLNPWSPVPAALHFVHRNFSPRRKAPIAQFGMRSARSEERRVGKECRARWSRYH